MKIENINKNRVIKLSKQTEYLVWQGCGGPIEDWYEGITKMLIENEIADKNYKMKEIYVFDNNDSCVNQLKQEFIKYNIYKHNNFFQFIDVKLLSSSELNDRKLLWDSFKYTIGYKDIDR